MTRLNLPTISTLTPTLCSSSMNGHKQGPNTTSSLKRSSRWKVFGENILRSKPPFSQLCRASFGVAQSFGDLGLKLAVWQYTYGASISPEDYADYNSFEHFIYAQIRALPTCWTGLPFENARRAYYADKTWPLELQKGYNSPLNALLRIPFEEGPAFLFRNAFPLCFFNYMFWGTYLTYYTWLKNKGHFSWIYLSFPYAYIKFIFHSFSFFCASVIAYPALQTRTMVDLWPKERGGHCTWNNSYRECYKWMIQNMELFYSNYMAGYWTWFRRQGAMWFIALWIADTYGMMDPYTSAQGGHDQQWAISSEYI